MPNSQFRLSPNWKPVISEVCEGGIHRIVNAYSIRKENHYRWFVHTFDDREIWFYGSDIIEIRIMPHLYYEVTTIQPNLPIHHYVNIYLYPDAKEHSPDKYW